KIFLSPLRKRSYIDFARGSLTTTDRLMARKSPTILQEELYSPDEETSREEDSRMFDLDVEKEAPFLRAQKRVSARRGTLPKKTATRLLWAAFGLSILLICVVAAMAAYHYGERDWRFRVESSDDIETSGLQNVTRAQVMEVMGGDIGRNIFFIPLEQRQAQLEQIPWVQSASVMRFVPNRLRIVIHERTPVAFARVGSKILLVDAAGTLMELPQKKTYSFPVIVGMSPNEPLSTRAARMEIYNDLISQLDSGGGRYSQDVSEVDLNDPDDVKVLTTGPDGEVLIHLGSSDYLHRYKIYVAHVREWRQQFSKIDSVDLRYDRQIVVNPDLGNLKPQVPLSANAAKAAMAAGVKQAALVNYERIAANASAEAAAKNNTWPKKLPVKAEAIPAASHAGKTSTSKWARKPAVIKAKPKYQARVVRQPAAHVAHPARRVERASLTKTANARRMTKPMPARAHSANAPHAVNAKKSSKPSPSIRKDQDQQNYGAHR
ncbi:MAG TPA: FtsQ-type POTRA domain-containing protein, partial [Terriglobales bacterium]|nr:FtsQ-type POTRA domain-containing protein [Terriglobales bacterium]